MSRLTFITLTLFVLSISCELKQRLQGRKPNIVFLLTDQWRAQDLGYMGNSDVHTPNIDLLETQSVNIVNAVSGTPVCSPYRASLFTGQYPLTHGVFYNDKPLKNEALTMAEIFGLAGYETGYIGKWHLNGHKPGISVNESREEPVTEDRRQGFDFWRVNECIHDYNNSFYYDEQNEIHFWNGYDAFAQADLACKYIAEKAMGPKPFLLMISVGPPHAPYQTAPEKYRSMYDDPSVLKLRNNVPDEFDSIARVQLAGYYAHIAAMDEVVGTLQNSIAGNGIEENTIFIFTSDHGDMLYAHGFQKKQQPYDESIRVPLLIKYPYALRNYNRKLRLTINSPDLLPTLLGLCGIDIPTSVEGSNYAGQLKSDILELDHPALISCQVPFHQWNYSKGGRAYRGIRSIRYTYVEDLDGPWLFFDNDEDPYQLHNLIGEKSKNSLQIEYHNFLFDQLKENGDRFKSGDFYMTEQGYVYDGNDSLRND